jgi:hypothetical protein
MVAFELFKCKSCGLELRRKRLAQRYCSERCRNAAVQNRKRRKQRSGDGKPHSSPASPQKDLSLSLHLEAVTEPQKAQMETMTYECQKPHPDPSSLDALAKALRRPVVNLTGKELPPELKARIVTIETANYPPVSAAPLIKLSVAA